MGKIILIIGGARSGKSTYALKLAHNKTGTTAFIATCEPKDTEMKKRISLHRAARPKNWTTLEVPCNITQCLKNIKPEVKTLVIDCLTLWITNLMMKNSTAPLIEKETKAMLTALKKMKTSAILVTNEVGLGIVPANKLARDFRDISGRVNQMAAEASNETYFMIAGIPWRIK